MGQLQKILNGITVRQRISIGIAAALATAGIFSVVHWNKERDFKPLYSSLSTEDAGAIVAKLKETGVEFRLGDSNSTVLAPSDRVAELRLQMAAAGIPKTGRIGYELFDKTNFGTTDFAEQVNYHRAVEGELERSIDLLAEVEQSRVHITFPKDSVFSENRLPAKASVMIKLKPGAKLSVQNAAAVTQLAASAVEGLTPESVSVMDMQGNLLLRPKKPGDGSQPSDEVLDYKAKLEHDLLNKVNSVLDPLLGSEKYRASIDVDCDMTSGEQSEETFDPTKSVMTNSQRTEQGSVKADTGGVPGTQSNLPRPVPRAAASGGSVASRSETVNYETSRVVKKTKLPQGIVRRMSVSVLVDQSIRWQKAGKGSAASLEKVIEPPTPDQLKIIRDVVAAAVGVNPARGDLLTVETLPFQATLKAEPPKPELPAAPYGKPATPKLPVPMPALIGIGAGLLLVIVVGAYLLVRSQQRARAKTLAMEQQLAAAQQAQTPALPEQAVEEAGPSKLDELGERHKKLMEASADFHLPPMLTSKTEVLTKHLTEESQKDPVLLAQIVRSWLNEERKN